MDKKNKRKKAASVKKWRKKNKAHLKEYNKKYKEENKESIKNYHARRYKMKKNEKKGKKAIFYFAVDAIKNYLKKSKSKTPSLNTLPRTIEAKLINQSKKEHSINKKVVKNKVKNLTKSQTAIYRNLLLINEMKNNDHTWDDIAEELGMHRDTLMKALISGVFEQTFKLSLSEEYQKHTKQSEENQ
jgi:hypothetical protein